MSGVPGASHVFLIHGTWARNAEWTREDAPLRRLLREALGDEASGTSINAFHWSGRNSFRARTDASSKLQALIHRLVEADGGARIYLVGHSHGGNIALQAAADPHTAPFVFGIVCLATPVIHSTLVATSKDDAGRAIRLWTTMAALVPVGLIADRVALDGATRWVQASPAGLIASLVALIAAVGVIAKFVVPRVRAAGRIGRFNQRAAVRLNRLLRPPTIDHARIVFVRHANDEATLTANFLGLLGWFSDRATLILEQRYRRLDAMLGSQPGRRLTIVFALGSIALVALLQFVRSSDVRAIAFAILFLALSVPPLVSLVLRLARAFGSLRTLFFGVAVVPIGSFIRMCIEPTPPGAWTVVMLPESTVASADDEAAAPIVDAHCRVNQQPEFLAFVSAWIAARIAEDRRAGS